MHTSNKSLPEIYDEMILMLRKLAEMEGLLKPCPGCGSMNQKPARIDLEYNGLKFSDSDILICQDCREKILLPITKKRIDAVV